MSLEIGMRKKIFPCSKQVAQGFLILIHLQVGDSLYFTQATRILSSPLQFALTWRALQACDERSRLGGISLPFVYRDIIMYILKDRAKALSS